MRLGIFGGTFNPIHWGHLLLAEMAREQLQLDRVLFIPTYQPPHKRAQELLPGPVRLKLIELAIKDNPAFVASDIELQRRGVSYSNDTVKLLKRQLPMATLFLLIGSDMLSVRWLAWDDLKRLCTVAVVRRPGASSSRREARVKWLTMPQVDISSSEVRRRLRAGQSIRYLVPPSVERSLRQHVMGQQRPTLNPPWS